MSSVSFPSPASLPFSRLAEISALKTAPAKSEAFVPSGNGISYSKYPLPAPFTFKPPKMFHCFCDHSALVKAFGAKRTMVVFPACSTRGASPSRTTKGAKLRATTCLPSTSEKQTTPTHGASGTCTATGPISPLCHDAAVKLRFPGTSCSFSRPWLSHVRRRAWRVSCLPA